MARLTRRGFIRSALAGLALTIAAPVLARFAPAQPRFLVHDSCRHLRDLLANAPPYRGLDHIFEQPTTLPPPRGSMIRFQRDPSRVFEL